MGWYSSTANTTVLEAVCDRTKLPIYFQKNDYDAGFNQFVTKAKTVDNAMDMLAGQLEDLKQLRKTLVTEVVPDLKKSETAQLKRDEEYKQAYEAHWAEVKKKQREAEAKKEA